MKVINVIIESHDNKPLKKLMKISINQNIISGNTVKVHNF